MKIKGYLITVGALAFLGITVLALCQACRSMDEKQADEEPAYYVMSPQTKLLLAWHEDMKNAMQAGDLDQAEKMARKILSNPDWKDWMPAYAVLGNVFFARGEYREAEYYYHAAISSEREMPPPQVWNNYADTLMQNGKLAEAEAVLRHCLAKTPGNDLTNTFQKTLNEVLLRKAQMAK